MYTNDRRIGDLKYLGIDNQTLFTAVCCIFNPNAAAIGNLLVADEFTKLRQYRIYLRFVKYYGKFASVGTFKA